jgi:hypothetical protein
MSSNDAGTATDFVNDKLRLHWAHRADALLDDVIRIRRSQCRYDMRSEFCSQGASLFIGGCFLQCLLNQSATCFFSCKFPDLPTQSIGCGE